MKIYTIQQIAGFKHLDESFLRRACRAGRLKAQKFGKGWLVTEDNYKLYLETRRKRRTKEQILLDERREYLKKHPPVPQPVKPPEKLNEKDFFDEEN